MEKLKTILLEKLSSSEMTFEEKENETRFCFWTSEKLTDTESLSKNLKQAGFEDFEKELKSLKRKGLLKTCLDDGTLHLTFKNELLGPEFLRTLIFD